MTSRILRDVQRTNQPENSQAKYLLGKIGKKEKKSELLNFDRIASGNFKKKAEETPYLTIERGVQPRKSREKNRLSSKSPCKKENSNENKLARLFSKEKKTVK